MNKLYSRINWKNYPSEDTSLDEANLNRMDLGLDSLDNRVIEMDAIKVNKEVANTLVKNWTMDEATGVITVEKLNGEKIIFDLNIEKIPVDFKLSEDGILTMTTDDGTKFTANIGAMIPVLTFEDSDEIAVSVSGSGVNKTYSFSIKAGSVTEDKLQPNFLADVKSEVTKAQASATSAATSETNAKTSETNAQAYAIGATNSAKYYYEQSKTISESFSGALRPMGTVAFAGLPTLASASEGDMYNVSNQFTTTADFKEGSGFIIPAGANVYKTSDGKWDILAGTPVTGVKGNKETTYRRGNVNITPENIGLGNVGNFKAVSTVASQGLTDTEKLNARANIGAGTSSFSGSYNDLSDKPFSVYNANEYYYYGNVVEYEEKIYRFIKIKSGGSGGTKGIVPTNTTYWKELTVSDLFKELSYATGILSTLTSNDFNYSGNPANTSALPYTVNESLSAIADTLSELNSNFSNYQPKGNYASASHNHDDRYLRVYEFYIENGFTSHDSNHYKWTFTAPVKGRYLFIVIFRPIGCQSSCRLKIGSTNSDPIGGVTNVPQYAFDSFPATELFNEGESKTLYFEIDKGCDPTIRLSVIKVGN